MRNAAPGTPNTISGQCVDEKGNPLAGVEVLLARVWWRDGRREPFSTQVTGADGRFRFADVVDIESTFPDGKFPVLPNPSTPSFQVARRAPGRVSVTEGAMLSQVAQRGSEFKVNLPPAATLRGRVTNLKGEPVAGALVSIGFSQLDRWEGFQTDRTDAEGRYEIPDAPRIESGQVVASDQLTGNSAAESGDSQNDRVEIHRMIFVNHPEYAAPASTHQECPRYARRSAGGGRDYHGTRH